MDDSLTSHPQSPAARVALIVSTDEWCADALKSVLEPDGYRVLRSSGGVHALQMAFDAAPDVILVTAGSRHNDALDLCRRLRPEGSIAAGTAVIMIAVAPTSLPQRLAALRAGARDVLSLPMNTEELLARLDAYVGVKLEADRIRTEGLLDAVSGLYGIRGVEYRTRELLADASRQRLPFACVVLEPDLRVEESTRVLRHIGKVLRDHSRTSDIIGRWGDTAFAVLAPRTHTAGAARLAQRLGQAVEASPPAGAAMPPLAMRAGYEVVDDAGDTPLGPEDLLVRAHAALKQARVETSLPRIRRYSPDLPRHSSP